MTFRFNIFLHEHYKNIIPLTLICLLLHVYNSKIQCFSHFLMMYCEDKAMLKSVIVQFSLAPWSCPADTDVFKTSPERPKKVTTSYDQIRRH